MVNTDDILREAETLESAVPAKKSEQKLDDVMLAMDVVDTLRHERLMVEKELSGEERRSALIVRLREIYDAQGIDVPDEILMDGVLALEEQRFVYDPPNKSLSTRLAKIYVNRRKWLPLIYTIIFIVVAAFAINYFGFQRPQQAEANRVERLINNTIPDKLEAAHEKALGLAKTDALQSKADDLYNLAKDDLKNQDAGAAEAKLAQLEQLSNALAQVYTIRIVSRPKEYSGVFRINEDSGTQVTNYYLIVEGITPGGEHAKVMINSEEDQKSELTNIWGVRVSEAVFNAVAADKKDDQIVQNAIIGQKKRGYLEPEYSVETTGGTILDW
ncbi:MAG: hypothetical protein HKN36_13750 [Hellea sp.]|nr:hypothetical protein [Hellea sp.]